MAGCLGRSGKKKRHMHKMHLTVPMLLSKEQLSSSSGTLIITPFFCHSQHRLTSKVSFSTAPTQHSLAHFNFLFLESNGFLFHRKYCSSPLTQLLQQPYLKTSFNDFYVSLYIFLSFTYQQPQKARRLSVHRHRFYPRYKCSSYWVRHGTISGRGGPPLLPSGEPLVDPWIAQLASWSP